MVLKSNKPVVLLFYHSDCPSCSILKIRLKKTIEKFKGQVYFYQMDIKTSSRWEDYDITQVPTLIFFRGNKPIGRLDSLPEEKDVENNIYEILSKVN